MFFLKWLEYCVARLVVTFLRFLPLKVAYFLGQQLGWLAWSILSERRCTVRNNLVAVQRWLQKKSENVNEILNPESIEVNTKLVFCRSGANLLSGFSFAALPLNKRFERVELVNLDILESAVKQGNGVVLLMAHMGPWEVVPSVLVHLAKDLGTNLGAIYRPLSNRLLEEWYRCHRETQGVLLFNRKEGLKKVYKFINGGGILALLADQRVKTGESSEFFGQPAMTTPLVGLLSKRVNAPVVSLTLLYDSSCKLKARFCLVDFEKAKTRSDYAKFTNQELERMISSDVTNAFWLHRRFST